MHCADVDPPTAAPKEDLIIILGKASGAGLRGLSTFAMTFHLPRQWEWAATYGSSMRRSSFYSKGRNVRAKGGVVADVVKGHRRFFQDRVQPLHLGWVLRRETSQCIFRRQLRQVIVTVCAGSMGGGRAKGGDKAATHLLCSMVEQGKASNNTAISRPYDFKNAYYEIMRGVVLPLSTDEQGLTRKLET